MLSNFRLFSVAEVKDRLKNVKDSMRKQVSSLPKTKSGAPAFEMASRITLPYFTMLLFMKDEFIGRTMTSSCPGNAQCTEEDNDNHNLDDDNQNEETDLLQRTMEESGLIAAESRCPSRESASSSSGGTAPKRRKSNKTCSDTIEQAKLEMLRDSLEISRKKMEEKKDPLEVFAMDLANDLKQIEDKRLLVQTKLELKQLTSKALLKQMDTVFADGASHEQQTYEMGTRYIQAATNIQPTYGTHLSTIVKR